MGCFVVRCVEMKTAPPQLRSAIVRAAVLPIALLTLLACVLAALVLYLHVETVRVAQSDRVIGRMHLLERLAIEQETGLRGYLLTGDGAFLEPYAAARDQLDAAGRELRQLLSDGASSSQ